MVTQQVNVKLGDITNAPTFQTAGTNQPAQPKLPAEYVTMADSKNAAVKWLKSEGPWKGCLPPFGGSTWDACLNSFRAGAKWQREQDAEMAEHMKRELKHTRRVSRK